MPLSHASLHRFELPSALLERGFWPYVWRIQERQNTRPIFYVGMTGDTGSYSAQSPINRVSGHLGWNENANALRKYAESKDIKLDSCWKIELAAFGPISTVPVIADDTSKALYRAKRRKVAALEKALWVGLSESGHTMLNDCPKCTSDHARDHLVIIREAFAQLLAVHPRGKDAKREHSKNRPYPHLVGRLPAPRIKRSKVRYLFLRWCGRELCQNTAKSKGYAKVWAHNVI